MKLKHTTILIIILILASALSGCAGAASAASSWPGLTAGTQAAYLAYNQQVYAIDLTNGNSKWLYPAQANNKISFFAAPMLSPDGQLLEGGYDNVLYSIDPNTGQENWSFKDAQNRFVASPLATDKGIFAPSADDSLYALDLKGNFRWKFTTKGALWATPVTDPGCSCIYLPSMDHHVYSLNADTGALNWESDDLGGSVVGTPAYSTDGVLYVGTFGSEMYALNAADGKVLWHVSTSGWVWGGPILQDGMLYFGDLNGTFYAMQASDGKVKWTVQPDGPITESPLVTKDSVYFTTEAGSLFALDVTNGSTRWSKVVGGKLYTSPVSADNLIIVSPVNADSLIYAYDTNGNQQWAFTLPKK
jgi:outer membrane protein assembly factor BamB